MITIKNNNLKANISFLIIIFSLFIINLLPINAQGQQNFNSAPKFYFPLKCTIDKDCWIFVYPDVDPGLKWKDPFGGGRTYDGHTGTDIAIENIEKMEQGLPVVAALEGTVVQIRDGVEDVNVKLIGKESVDKYECGNRVGIYHGNGWYTDYCHMHKGSITVKKGEHVFTGQKLGNVGMSGLTEFPHLHFQVYHFKEKVDPFTGQALGSVFPIDLNHKQNQPLWKTEVLKKLKYYPSLIYNIGITEQQPNILDIQGGNFSDSIKITPYNTFIYLWSDILSVEKGDSIKFIINDPSGKRIFTKQFTIDKNNVRKFIFTGYNHLQKWETGTYKLKVNLYRSSNGFEYEKNTLFEIK